MCKDRRRRGRRRRSLSILLRGSTFSWGKRKRQGRERGGKEERIVLESLPLSDTATVLEKRGKLKKNRWWIHTPKKKRKEKRKRKIGAGRQFVSALSWWLQLQRRGGRRKKKNWYLPLLDPFLVSGVGEAGEVSGLSSRPLGDRKGEKGGHGASVAGSLAT